MYCNFIILV